MSTITYRTEAAAVEALTRWTLRYLPGYDGKAARQRARDFLAALRASGQPGMVYPCGPAAVWVERHA